MSKADPQASPDYYFNEQGLMVMTAAFHLKRGYCCGNACKHCPYGHENVPEHQKKPLQRDDK